MAGISSKILLKVILTALALLRNADCSDLLEKTKEGLPCFEPETVSTSLFWAFSVNEWYYPVMSKLDLSMLYLDLTGRKSEDVMEPELYKNACINWTISPLSFSYEIKGYGRSKFYKFRPLDFWFSKLEFFGEEGELPGIAYTTLTDNKSFIFTAACLTDLNEMTWAVQSPFEILPNETLELIYSHAESLGFKRKYFTSQNYEKCLSLNNDDYIDKVEL